MTFQAYIDNIQEKTGMAPEDFKAAAEEKGLLRPDVKAGEIVGWLNEEFASLDPNGLALDAFAFEDGTLRYETLVTGRPRA